jgi:hypothetical protein
MASTVAHSSLLGQAARTHAAAKAKAAAGRWLARVGGPVREHALTISACGCADAAGFLHSTIVGLVVTAVSLLIADFKIQG